MPEKRDLTRYQQGVIRRYYQNQDQLREQSLADLVTDLYLATTDKKREALWKRARTLLEGLNVAPATVEAVMTARNPKALAEMAARGFQADRKQEWKRDAKDAEAE